MYIYDGFVTNWKNYNLQMKFKSVDDDAIGIVFRYSSPDNFYRLVLSNEDACSMLLKVKTIRHYISAVYLQLHIHLKVKR